MQTVSDEASSKGLTPHHAEAGTYPGHLNKTLPLAVETNLTRFSLVLEADDCPNQHLQPPARLRPHPAFSIAAPF